MGWCSATEIMDALIESVDKVAAEMSGPAAGEPEIVAATDDLIRPVVARVATALRDGDWDCIEESTYFDRFRQEMLGYDDEAMIGWYRDRLTEGDDPQAIATYSQAMIELMKGRDN
jgi:hypothetical protein